MASQGKMQELDVDSILPLVGEFSRFQYVLEALLCISIIPQALQEFMMYFAAHNSPWRCTYNSTVCTFPQNMTFSLGDSLYEERCKLERKEWEFVYSKDYSIMTQFDLYCDGEIYGYLTTSLFFIGWAVGAVAIGIVADRFGRRKVMFPSVGVIIIVGFLSTFSPNVWVFLTTRIIVGFFTPGTGVQMFVVASEFVGTRYRPLSGIILWSFYAVSLIILGVQAYFIREWKKLYIISTVPYIFVLAFAKFVPESIRWLNLNGRQEEAMKLLRRIAKFNKKQLPDNVTLKAPCTGPKVKANPIDLFVPTKMALQSLVQSYVWVVNGLVYYGVTLASDTLSGAMYQDFILTSLVEFPAIVFAIYFCNAFGRKKTVIISLATASIACLLIPAIPTDQGKGLSILRILVGMIGKCGVATSFDSLYTWAVEIYPTVIRSQGLGLLQIASRIGSAGAPWIASGLRPVHASLPFIVMGGSSLIAVAMLFYLPETKGVNIAETLGDKDGGKEFTVDFQKEADGVSAKVNMAYNNADEDSRL
ncbi:solute carrier family 22 member 15-like [Rhopilema esculentum]|uniref:solute carrier family 22 member 15-like n=1 Tax=Rhopilema esculentum TaxID=499914 RepID=UPI0031E2FA7F|eukprot:gene1036-15364_t